MGQSTSERHHKQSGEEKESGRAGRQRGGRRT